jgi:hypothetical protein
VLLLLLLLVGPVVLDVLVGVLDVLALPVDVLVLLVDVLVPLVEPEVVLLVPGSVVGPQPRATALSSAELRSMRDRLPVSGEDRVVTAPLRGIEHRRYGVAVIGVECTDDVTCEVLAQSLRTGGAE